MSKKVLLLSGAVGCVLLLLCVSVTVAAIAGYMLLAPQLNASMPVNRIAIVDNDANIQIVDALGEHPVAVTTDAAGSSEFGYTAPTWSPDSQHLAFVGVGSDLAQNEIALYTAPLQERKQKPVFKSALQTPFYLYWSPDSQSIGFLASSNTDMAMLVASADGKSDAVQIDTGSPLYWAWSPDSKTMLTHIGGSAHQSRQARMNLRKRQSNETGQALTHRPASFQAPQYSADGSSILYATADGANGDALFIADAQDNNARRVADFEGTIGFAWSPNGKKIAYLVTPDDAPLPTFGPVWIVDSDGNNRKQITQEDTLGFFWSPNGENIAFLTAAPPGNLSDCQNCGSSRALNIPSAQSQTIHLRWQVMNLASGSTHVLATFAPTRDLINVIPYFDQYARSLTFWSPDSTQFVYAKNEDDGTGTVWVANIDEKIAPRRIGNGVFAVWSWK